MGELDLRVATTTNGQRLIITNRTWDGIDKPEYNEIASLSYVDAISLRDKIDDFIDTYLKSTMVTLFKGTENTITVPIKDLINDCNNIVHILKQYGAIESIKEKNESTKK